jgi:hypothetical protein
MVVVATGLVNEARSNRVAGGASGESSSYVKCPKALSATTRSRYVTTIDPAGKAWAAIASSRIEKGEEKVLSCWSWAGTRVGSELFRGYSRKVLICAGYNRTRRCGKGGEREKNL